MRNPPTARKRLSIITFSGIDGAGKSTQIESLQNSLKQSGRRTKLYAFWDDVVAFSGLRESASHTVFQGDPGTGSPEKPISRRDKNVQSWYAIAARLVFYFVDTLSLRRTVTRISKEGADVAIFDRYIYDELANLPLEWRLIRLYVKAILKLAPAPDLALLVDADPEEARLRKPEYPLPFLHRNRNAYLALSRMIPTMLTIEPASIDVARNRIEAAVFWARASVVSQTKDPFVLARQEISRPAEGPR